MVMSSATACKWGRASEISRPALPHFLKLKGEGISVPGMSPFEMAKLNSRLGAVPASLVSIGLGSNKSTWLGPPFMKSWMTLLALGAKCVGLGFRS